MKDLAFIVFAALCLALADRFFVAFNIAVALFVISVVIIVSIKPNNANHNKR